MSDGYTEQGQIAQAEFDKRSSHIGGFKRLA